MQGFSRRRAGDLLAYWARCRQGKGLVDAVLIEEQRHPWHVTACSGTQQVLEAGTSLPSTTRDSAAETSMAAFWMVLELVHDRAVA